MLLIWTVMKMTVNPQYKSPKTGAGELKTFVHFLKSANSGPDPGGSNTNDLYSCTAEVYNPSMKDLEVMKANGSKKGVTIKIRDPLQDYQPSNKHKVKIDDFRYEDIEWDITDARPDVQNSKFIIILLGASA